MIGILNTSAMAQAVGLDAPAPMVQVICSWCSKDLGLRPCEPAQAGKISHTICPICSEKFASGAKPTFAEVAK